MHMYHYTTEPAWRQIRYGYPGQQFLDNRTGETIDGRAVRGLWPRRSLFREQRAPGLPAEAYRHVTFGLPHPAPRSWTRNEEFGNVLGTLLENMLLGSAGEKVLLKVTLKPMDRVEVVDYAHWARVQDQDFRSRSDAEHRAACRNYWESAVPLRGYNNSYALPEIIVSTSIPLRQIEKVWQGSFGEVWSAVGAGVSVLSKTAEKFLEE